MKKKKDLNRTVTRKTSELQGTSWKEPWERGTPFNGLYGEAPPKRGTFFRLQVYERVGISIWKGRELCHFIL